MCLHLKNTFSLVMFIREEVEPGSFRLVNLCLNQLAMLYLNVFQATQTLIYILDRDRFHIYMYVCIYIYGFVGLTPKVLEVLFMPSIFGTF